MPNGGSPLAMAAQLLCQARVLAREPGTLGQAETSCRAAVAILHPLGCPRIEFSAWRQLGFMLQNAGDAQAAFASFESAVRCDPSQAKTILTSVRGKLLSSEQRQWLTAQLRQLPDSGQVELALAEVDEADNRPDAAIIDYTKAIEDFKREHDDLNRFGGLCSEADLLNRLGRMADGLTLVDHNPPMMPAGSSKPPMAFQLDILAIDQLRFLEALNRFPEGAERTRAYIESLSDSGRKVELLSSLVREAHFEGDEAEEERNLRTLGPLFDQLSVNQRAQTVNVLARTLSVDELGKQVGHPALARELEEQLRNEIAVSSGMELNTALSRLKDLLGAEKRNSEAIEVASQQVAVCRSLDGSFLTSALNGLFWELYKVDRLEEAEQVSQEVAKLSPTSQVDLLEVLGNAWSRRPDSAKAREFYRLAMSHPLTGQQLQSCLEGLTNVAVFEKNWPEGIRLQEQIIARPEVSAFTRFQSRLWAASFYLLAGQREHAQSELHSLYDLAWGQPNVSQLAQVASDYTRALDGWKESAEAVRITLATEAHLIERLNGHPLLGRELRNDSAVQNFFREAAGRLIKSGRAEDFLKLIVQARSPELLKQFSFDFKDSTNPRLEPLVARYRELVRELVQPQPELNNQGELTALLQLRQREPGLADQVGFRATELKTLQKSLSLNQRLLEFYPGRDGLIELLVAPDSFSVRAISLSRTRLSRLVTDLRASMMEGAGKTSDPLYELLIAPVAAELKGHEVLLRPTGPLWYVPFGALKSKGHYWTESCQVAYLSAGDLLKLMNGQFHEKPQAGTTLAIGPGSRADLAGATAELNDLIKSYPGCVRLHSRQQLLEAAGQGSLLHFATHAVSRGDAPGQSYLETPDARLTLTDIYSLALPRDALVVLSACQTGMGETDPGAEPSSLATAFSVAGAGTVISSLWPVEDQATELLFANFYRNLASGKGRLDSLCLAQKACRARYPQPFYWAGFTLMGNPQ
jgi:CHAT domain-containing protein